ncbi:MAG TPA: hypothetical protein VFG74_10370 [Miltoncostaeaceae bacterium]|jgi:hypothetical protein|nr:hypothetical protein [Miltoncostaeaceae bacterium]
MGDQPDHTEAGDRQLLLAGFGVVGGAAAVGMVVGALLGGSGLGGLLLGAGIGILVSVGVFATVVIRRM